MLNVLEFKSCKEEITAPKLKLWFKYRSEISTAMMDICIKKEVEQYLESPEYQIPYEQRKIILNKAHSIIDGKYEEWMMTKLKNALSFNRTEICECIKH